MLVPKFRCFQDENFVKVEIVLSALCKVAEAQFDILEHQFTFSCSPYFLRLTFPCQIAEEKGERATYDLESNVLTVFVPKLNTGEEFPGLDFPNKLLATSKQRKEMGLDLVREVGEEKKKNDDEGEDEEEEEDDEMNALETEFDQMLQVSEQQKREKSKKVGVAGKDDTKSNSNNNDDDQQTETVIYYGFNNQFSRFFSELDEDLTKELLDLASPDTTEPLDRKKLRREDENAKFDEGAFLFSMNDEEGEIENDILPFKPWYVQCFEEALISAGRRQKQQQDGSNSTKNEDASSTSPGTTAPPTTTFRTPADIGAAPTNDAITSNTDSIWEGNTIEIRNDGNNNNKTKTIQDMNLSDDATLPVEGVEKVVVVEDDENSSSETTTATVFSSSSASQQSNQFQQKASRGGLAFTIPAPKIPSFTMDESTTLQTIPAKNFFLHSEALVCWQLCDLLAATVYDTLTTQGQGNVESSWTITKLSTCLSWLDAPLDAKEFADTFCRRVLTFPLHRHFGLALRCLRDVSVLLLSGTKTIVKFLLYTKGVIDSCDTSGSKHALSGLWINPMLSWLTSEKKDDEFRQNLFIRAADELHGYIVRGEIPTPKNKQGATSSSIATIGSRKNAAMMIQVVGNDDDEMTDKIDQEKKKISSNPEWKGAELKPLAWTDLKLPFSEELMAEVAE